MNRLFVIAGLPFFGLAGKNDMKAAMALPALCIWLLAGGASAASVTRSDPFPSRPIRFVVPFPPGAGADVVARMIASPMSETLGQPFVIDNRSGAAGTVGTSTVAKALPDGHTILLITATFSISAAYYSDLPYNAISDFAAVGRIATGPLALVVHPSLQARSVKELVALAKAHPGKLNYASGGQGGINHLAAEMLKSATAAQIVEVNYKGGGPALTALLSGETQVMVATLGSCLSQIRAGRLRALALGSKQRTALLPDLPTMAESGVPGYEAETWYAILAPKGAAASSVQRLNQAMVSGLQARDLQEKLVATGFEAAPSTASEFADYLKSEIAKWARVMKTAGIARN